MNIEYIINTFAAKQAQGHYPCPRCGCNAMDKENVRKNALSRRANIYVCDACGGQEAIEDMNGKIIKPLETWFITVSPEHFDVAEEAARPEKPSDPFTPAEIDYLKQCVDDDISSRMDELKDLARTGALAEMNDMLDSMKTCGSVLEKLAGYKQFNISFAQIAASLPSKAQEGYHLWSDGTAILCKTEDAANAIADLLEALLYACGQEVNATTGYYDPEVDGLNGDTDEYTGWHYVDIG